MIKSEEIQYKVVTRKLTDSDRKVFNIGNIDGIEIFGAFFQDELIGLLAVCKKVIVRLFVLPIFRRYGIGSKLLSFVQEQKTRQNFIFKCNSFEHNINALNNFLLSNGWDALQYDYTSFCVDIRSFSSDYAERYFNLDMKLNLRFEYLSSLSNDELENVSKQAEKLVPEFLYPFKSKYMIPDLFLVVLDKEKIIAWSSATTSNKKDEVYLGPTYISSQYRSSGLGLYIWYLTYKRIYTETFAYIKWVSFDFDKNNKRLNRLYNRLFKGHIREQYDSFISIKKNSV